MQLQLDILIVSFSYLKMVLLFVNKNVHSSAVMHNRYVKLHNIDIYMVSGTNAPSYRLSKLTNGPLLIQTWLHSRQLYHYQSIPSRMFPE